MAASSDIAKAVGLDVPKIEDLFEVILRTVARGDHVSIRGFGTFERKTHKGRTQVTPLVEGGKITYDDKFLIKFKPSATAKERLNTRAKAHEGKGSKKTKKKKAEK